MLSRYIKEILKQIELDCANYGYHLETRENEKVLDFQADNVITIDNEEQIMIEPTLIYQHGETTWLNAFNKIKTHILILKCNQWEDFTEENNIDLVKNIIVNSILNNFDIISRVEQKEINRDINQYYYEISFTIGEC